MAASIQTASAIHVMAIKAAKSVDSVVPLGVEKAQTSMPTINI
ncbi:hypothetical protein [Brevundimonas sp. NPDC029107]